MGRAAQRPASRSACCSCSPSTSCYTSPDRALSCRALRRGAPPRPWSLPPLLLLSLLLLLPQTAALSFRRKVRLPTLNVTSAVDAFTAPRPPPPLPPLAVQQEDARKYFEWAKKDQYKYSTVPIKGVTVVWTTTRLCECRGTDFTLTACTVEPAYGTDYVNSGWTMFYSNLPVTWIITQLGGSHDASVSVLEQTETHLQIGAGSQAGVWRITAAATSCLDTCQPANCPAQSCTAQMGSPACADVAAGTSAHPGKACNMAYFVSQYRVISPAQIAVGVLAFVLGLALAWYYILGCDCSNGMPGWWVFSDSTSWTVKAKPVAPPLPPSVFQPRPTQQRLRLDIDATGAAKEAPVRAAPRMFRSAQEQEKAMIL